MAATKSKTKPSSKSRSKAKAKAKPSSKSRSKAKAKAAKAKAKSATNSKRGSKVKASRAGAGSKKSAEPLVEKLKVPAAATGAALIAVAGSVAVSQSRSGKSKLGRGISGKKVMKAVKKVDLPKADDAIDWIEDKAKEVGNASNKVAEASSQARSAKKAVSGK